MSDRVEGGLRADLPEVGYEVQAEDSGEAELVDGVTDGGSPEENTEIRDDDIRPL
ncbi:hypothetical protein DXG03_008234, partial [Asterophora parasitica]